jgi:hypothetical protein
MLTFDELVDLARLCAYNSLITTDREVARVLCQMASEYQEKDRNAWTIDPGVTNAPSTFAKIPIDIGRLEPDNLMG